MYMPGPRNMIFTNIPTQRYASHVVINHANSGNIVYTNISNSNNISGNRRARNHARPTDREATSRRDALERLESLEDLENPCAPVNDQISIVSTETEESAADEWVDVEDGEDSAATSTQDAVPAEAPPPYTARESTRTADAEPQLQHSATPECPGFATLTIFQNGDVRRQEMRLCTHETRECNNKREMIRRQQSTPFSAQAPVVSRQFH